MKASQVSFAIVAFPTALADFWMVYQRRYAQIGRIETTSYGTSFVNDMKPWTCEDDIFTHRIFPDQQDVSDDKYGVKFDPWVSMPGPLWHNPLLTLEMNLYPSPMGRQTISYDADYAMFDVDKNEKSGQCFLNRTFIFDLDCWVQPPDPNLAELNVKVNGSSMFFYESDIEVDENTLGWGSALPHSDDELLR
ncbi:hypothetical protein O1611_g3392 [Lasiodiplodia mahajangana]|uniref:Uncharacterized protein n=1 Tax=Lasiodiplodia mahajangana TaxID=1108764 RepID=A0ACC2JRX5_9PEZI|nr:hypothetical protein O1611_g3392 [Lasiodiplodia mahajangana]